MCGGWVRLSFILSLSTVSGCSIHAGIAIHSNSFDSFKSGNPLGVVRGEFEHSALGDVKLFCEHVSGVGKEYGGYGLNMCGGMGRIW